MPRRWWRKTRSFFGLPASEDVGLLAGMIGDLRSQVERFLGHSIEVAGVTTMKLAALYREDFFDAFEQIGLKYLDISHDIIVWRDSLLSQTAAAYAGYGYGICTSYTDLDACQQELNGTATDYVMAVLYTSTALTVTLSVVDTAYALWEPPYRHLSDFTLGYDARNSSGSLVSYWDLVKLQLEEIMYENPYYDRPTKVVVMGDCADAPAFQQALKEALKQQGAENATILSSHPVGVAAAGAAEFVKRLPYEPHWNRTRTE